jgi:predicted GNAT superfamily acetyltransferase
MLGANAKDEKLRCSQLVNIRPLLSFEDLRAVPLVEKRIWGLSEEDILPMTFIIASCEAGAIWLGAFAEDAMVGFAFGFLGREDGEPVVHSHMLGVVPEYRDLEVGYRLKLAQRDCSQAMGIQNITWTFDPLQSKNAHLNFAKLGVISRKYRVNFYGPETSSVLHRNGTDRLWVKWRLNSNRVCERLLGTYEHVRVLDSLRNLVPLVQFDGNGRPTKADLHAALGRQRVAIEIPVDIGALEMKGPALAYEWREATRWAFGEALRGGFVVEEFCRALRGNQRLGIYLLQKATIE